jgi:polyhydroxybutyrate depolymerase
MSADAGGLDVFAEVDAANDSGVDASDAESDAGVDAPPMDAGPRFVGGERPASFAVPRGYDPAVPAPLLIVLHGFGASGPLQDLYFDTQLRASEHGMLLVYPDGTENAGGSLFWHAPDTCCDPVGESPDDVAYIVSLIDDMDELFNVDRRRVYLYGHSNGAFMSYRIACDAPEAITAIASLAGATVFDEAGCTPSVATSVLQIHGTMDERIPLEGGEIFGVPFPGAVESVRRHALFAGCGETVDGDAFEFTYPEGTQTRVSRYEDCDEGFGAELWTIDDGGHVPGLRFDASDRVLTWLEQWSR